MLGEELRDDVQPLTGSGAALAVGLFGALWAGLGVTVALGRAFAEIWDTPRVEQPRGFKTRARGLVLLAILGQRSSSPRRPLRWRLAPGSDRPPSAARRSPARSR